jgi:hypothetical protein
MDDLRHIKYYKEYINEQVFPEEGAVSSAAPVEEIYSFIFIEDGDDGDYSYPDGSSSKRYPTYQISKKDLTDWVDKAIKTDDFSKSEGKVSKDSIIEYVIGEKSSITPKSKEIIEKFKNACISDIAGKKIEDTEVMFHPDQDVPTTDSIDVTFIITPK